MRLATILGTRPEIIKLAPIIGLCSKLNIENKVIHTGQHYDKRLSENILEDLGIRPPDYNLNVGSAADGMQTGAMLQGIEKILMDIKPDYVLFQGDTDSTLAGALAASKLNIDCVHIEAGLRSFDRTMPEETNRAICDHISDYLFAPTRNAVDNLMNEGLDERFVFMSGNTFMDTFSLMAEKIKESRIIKELGLGRQGYIFTQYVLLTCHRRSNVSEEAMRNILYAVSGFARKYHYIIIYPAHPRTRETADRLISKDKKLDNIYQIGPLNYTDFLKLELNASLVVTDSGGIQEEACALSVPCVTLRDNTERPETIEAGANILAGTDMGRIENSCIEMISWGDGRENPYGKGGASSIVIETLLKIHSENESERHHNTEYGKTPKAAPQDPKARHQRLAGLTSFRSKMVDWLMNECIDPYRGGVNSWINPNNPSFFYPEINGYMISLMCWLHEKYNKKEYLDAAKLCADYIINNYNRSGDGMRRDGFEYLFDSAVVLKGLKRLEAKDASGSSGYRGVIEGLEKFCEAMFEKENAVSPVKKTNHWSYNFGCHIIKTGYSITLDQERYKKIAQLSMDTFDLAEGHFHTVKNLSLVHTHPHCYATEGIISLNHAGHDFCPGAVDNSARWLAKNQRENGSMYKYYEVKGKDHNAERLIEVCDSTAQAIRIWSLVDKKQYEDNILRGISFLKDNQSSRGGLFYSSSSRDINSWATIFAVQALEFFVDGPQPEWIT